ncbi:aminoacyl-tRNA deacylase [Neokomagataea anthophila]|uniref:Cys-tRNA(Pro)/Cys-tRNA(Cys) deacylase n=1 Tax=Neokomagataea anthophila TaxID=2826925 RepID=A0ABS5E7I5_9PROT|nr:aminoacyl-tRNA deacylase [Neokomagataea anthophila]MBR0559871.1 aminoacyl-tRNA deacylase [Neokomagataea anthophila]
MTDHQTPATLWLDALSIPYTLHEYAYDSSVDRLGIAAAQALQANPKAVLKTLMVKVDGSPACVVLPVDCEMNFARVAQALNGRKAKMMQRPDAESHTGYQIGGVSPFGQKRPCPIVFDKHALDEKHPQLIINAGARGLLLSIAPDDALAASSALVADLTSP